MQGGLFIEKIFGTTGDQFYFVSVVVICIVSICLHELAHGWAALWEGDRTPVEMGHMSFNPFVHMGWISLIMLLMMGMAFGLMPVNPSRFRHKYGDAIVSAAGPAMNLLIAVVCLTTYALWRGGQPDWEGKPGLEENLGRFLWWAGAWNIAGVIFNLLPIPPLDGSRILGDFHPPFRRWTQSVANPQVFYLALFGVLVLSSLVDFGLFDLAFQIALSYSELISGQDLVRH